LGYLTAKQFSEKWGISERRIIKLCKENRIDGAIKNGMVWLMPEDTLKPSDKRRKISQYIQTEKNIAIINLENQIEDYLLTAVKKEGYNTIIAKEINFSKKETLKSLLNSNEKYFSGLIIVDFKDSNIENKKYFIKEFSKKMDCESSIVLVNRYDEKRERIEKELSEELEKNIGVRINSINLKLPQSNKFIMDYKELADDICKLLTGYKNTTGISIETNSGVLEFQKNNRTKNLSKGKFYKALNYYFKKLDKNSNFWAASIMLEDEWTEEPLEMNFRIINLEAANRGANLERIFIFSQKKIKEFKNNKTLKIYMQNKNINMLYVDYDEILEKQPELLKIVGSGWDGFDDEAIIADIECDNERGYVSINTKEIQEKYECFKKLKEYSKDLRKILM
jgi:hypothetical protein